MIFEINDYDDFLESADEVGGNSRDITVDQTECQLAKMIVALESAEEMYDLNLREAELKCYAESGTDDDFMTFVEAAGADLAQKTDSLIKRIWAKVVQFFTQLKDKILGKAGKDLEKEDKVQCPKPVAFVIKKFNSLWGGVKSAIASAKGKLSENPNWKKLVAALMAAVAVIGSVVVIKQRKFEKKFVSDQVVSELRAMPNKGTMAGSDLTTLTGKEFNDAYYKMNDAIGYVQKYSHQVYKRIDAEFKWNGNDGGIKGVMKEAKKGAKARVNVDAETDKAKCLSTLGSLLKPIASKFASIRSQKSKTAAAEA